jgi:hypothetical protein
MRVKIQTVGDGLHPSEAIVTVATADGTEEELVVDKRSIEDGSIRIGYPVDSRGDRFLIELPRETSSGTSRVWVRRGIVEDAA